MSQRVARDGGREPTVPAQVPTGVPGLDHLLNGGLRQGGLHVVLGGPGMGKSVLAHQIGANLIRAGGKVLYLTALVETHQTLLSQAKSFRFFDPAVVPGSFYYASLYPAMAQGGLKSVRAEVSRLIAGHDPTLMILDGVHALKVAATGDLEYQQFMHEMEAQSAVTGVTALLLAHPPRDGISSDPTFTIADAVFEMGYERVRMRQVRTFGVTKLRGVGHVGGWHTFRITPDGIFIYPRTESLAGHMEARVSGPGAPEDDGALLDVAIEGLGEMLGGGLGEGTVTLVIGTPGSGKTLFGLAFASAGVEAGEPCLFAGYHELPGTLIRKGEGVGLPIARGVEEGKLHLHWRAPTEMLADEEAHRLLETVRAHGIRRVVVDAVENLRQAVIPPRARPPLHGRPGQPAPGARGHHRAPPGPPPRGRDQLRHAHAGAVGPGGQRAAHALRGGEGRDEAGGGHPQGPRADARPHPAPVPHHPAGDAGGAGLHEHRDGAHGPGETPLSGRDPAPRPRVLVADDEPAITALVAEMLGYVGFDVVEARGGVEAVALARREHPDLVLLDVMMPDLDGRDACKLLKMEEELRGVPVLLFSSADERDVHWRGAGADGFLQKPFSIRALPEVVRAHLSPLP